MNGRESAFFFTIRQKQRDLAKGINRDMNKKLQRSFSVFVAFVMASVTTATADETANNWHRFRGPDGNGVSTTANPPTSWGASSDNLKWKVEIPGKGSSSPIVWGDRIFVMTAVDTKKTPDGEVVPDAPAAQPGNRSRGGRGRGGRGGSRGSAPKSVNEFWVICLNRADGKEIWKKKVNEAVPHEGTHQTNTFCSGSPVTDGKHVYALFGSWGLYCLDMDGNLVWKRDLGKMRTRNSFGEGVSPALYEDHLVVNWDHEGQSFIEVMDAKTGKTKWKKDRPEKTGWATPRVVKHGDRVQIIVVGPTVKSYDLNDGSIVWQCSGQTGNPIPTPFIFEDLAICMTGFRSSACYAIPLNSEGDISDSDKIAWSTREIGPYVPTGVLYKGTVYATKASTPAMGALNAKTGETVIDVTRLNGIRSLYSSMVAAADHIFITGRGGTTIVLRHGDKLDVASTNDLGEPVDATPALVGNQIFIRGEKNLYCFENKKQGQP